MLGVGMRNTTFCVCAEGPKAGLGAPCLKLLDAAQSRQGESVPVDLCGFISVQMPDRGRYLITTLVS